MASPGGLATPAFGDDHTVVRLAGARLVVERGSSTAGTVAVDGASLRSLAALAGAHLDRPFHAGDDTPPLGDVDEALVVDHRAALALGDWYGFGWRVLDEVLAADGGGASRVQLWPEHFDAGCHVPVGPGDEDRANIGASPGDGPDDEPYLYVVPWGADRPGDPSFWNAAFGAALTYGSLRSTDDPVAAGVAFLERGLALIRG